MSVALARLGAHHVIATDADERVLRLIGANAAWNHARIEVLHWNWHAEPNQALCGEPDSINVIVGSVPITIVLMCYN